MNNQAVITEFYAQDSELEIPEQERLLCGFRSRISRLKVYNRMLWGYLERGLEGEAGMEWESGRERGRDMERNKEMASPRQLPCQ